MRIAAVAAIAGWLAAAFAAPAVPEAIQEVRDAYAQCLAVHKSAKPVAVYERSAGKPPAVTWQRERPAEDQATGRAMTVYSAGGKPQMVLERIDAPSGDWRQRIQHCFRPDGSLAFVLSTLRTFHGNVQVEDRLYFNPQGRQLRALRQVTDLKTNKPRKADDTEFMEQKPTLFRTADELVRALGAEVIAR